MITEQNISHTLDFTTYLVKDCYPRLTGSPGCEKAVEFIEGEMQEYCDRVEVQEFTHHPDAFLKFFVWYAIINITATVLIAFNYVTLSLFCLLLNLVLFVSQFVTYEGLFDTFYKKKKGHNVIGTIEPEREVKQQILISGHHDAPYVFHLIEKFSKIYAFLAFFGFAGGAVGLVGVLIWQFWKLFNDTNVIPPFANWVKISMVVLMVLGLPIFFFTTKKVSPGAGDNAIAVALINETGKKFGLDKKKGKNRLQHTRLIVASFDAEESGLRGARSYVFANREQLTEIPTFVYNIDSIYEPEDLNFFTKDLNSTLPLSKKETEFCLAIADGLGYKINTCPIPFGGGATDAAEFAKAGIESVSMVGIGAEVLGSEWHYHTERDTVDRLSSTSIKMILEILEKYIETRDRLVR